MSNKFFVRYKLDKKFLICILMLIVIGVIMVYSSSYFEIGFIKKDQNALLKKELVFVALGLTGMWIMSIINYNQLRKLVIPLNIFSVITYILLLPRFNLSIEIRGGTRWIGGESFQFMPSDIAKYAAILSLAYILSLNKEEKGQKIKNFFIALCPIFYIVGTILQPDVSTTVVFVGTMVTMLYIGALKVYLIGGLTFFSSLGAIVFILTSQNRLKRVKIFLDPFSDPLKEGYQIIQSMVAIATGGLYGVGLGASKQKMLYLPLSYNDYIFAIYAEEFGFLGSLILIAIFSALIFIGLKIASNAPDKFSTLLASGIIAQVGIQAIINLFVSVNLIPSTGINLPIISYGGTSLITTLGALGIVLGISRFENRVIPTAYKPVQQKK